MDVAFVDVRLEGSVRTRDQIGIARGIDDDLSKNGVAALLALENRALDGVAPQDRSSATR